MNNKHNGPGFGVLLFSQCSIVGVALFLLWLLDVQIPEPRLGVIQAAVVGAALAIITLVLLVFIYRFGGRFAQSLVNDLHRITAIFSGYSAWHFVLIAALAGIGEELLFRGFLQIWLSQYFSVVTAVAVASLIFGLLHYLSHAYFICATIMSIAFGVGYYLTDSLLMVMVWHGVYDFLALLILMKFPHIVGIDALQKR